MIKFFYSVCVASFLCAACGVGQAMTPRQKELCAQIIPPLPERSLGAALKQSLKDSLHSITFGVFEDSTEEKLGKVALNLADIFGWETAGRYGEKQLGTLIIQATDAGHKYMDDRGRILQRFALTTGMAGVMRSALSELEANFLNSIGWMIARDFDRGEFVELPQTRGFWRKM